MAGTTNTNSYLGAFNFRVRVAGINDPLDGFLKVSQITSKTESMEFKHGLDRAVRKAPGRTSYNDVTLERVYSGLDDFARWRQAIVEGNVDRRTVSIEFLRNNGTEVVRRYELYGAYPSQWDLPEMNAGSSSTAIERITLSVENVVQLQ